MPGRSAERRPANVFQKELWGEQSHQIFPNPTSRAPSPSMQPRRKSSPQMTTPSLWEQALLLTPQPSILMLPGSESTQAPPATTIYQAAEPKLPATLSPPVANKTPELHERIQRRGVATLSSAELLSLVLRTGEASESIVPRLSSLLNSYSVQQILQVDFGELCEQYGLGEAKAAKLQAVLEVARRLTMPTEQEKYTIRSPEDAVALVRPEMEFLDHEQLRVLALNTKNQVEANLLLYQGTINSSVLRVAEIFRPAITRKCPNIIVCHNHPSGDPTPSPEDIDTTQQLAAAGVLLEVDLLDHLIIGRNPRFTSLKERMRW